jgi:hypothetical protein
MAQTPNDGAIAERAGKSLGLLTIRQLDAMGVTRQRRRTLMACGTYLAAAALWRFEGIGRGPVEVTVPAGRHPAPDHGTIHRSRDLVAPDIEPRASL